jgi:MFS family permease
MKSVKPMVMGFGLATLVAAFAVAALPAGPAWMVAYFLVNVLSNIYGMFGIGIIIGQWFPTRKGVFMGIATFAFPVCNGLMGPFAGIVFNEAYLAANHRPNVLGGFLPFLIVGLVGWLIGLIFIKDYPEQVGCFRDNDKSFTKEKADAMLAAEIEAKKTTVWKLGNTLKCGSFWLITIPMGTLLACSVGAMTQTTQIFAANGLADKFEMLMGMVMIFALIGSYVLGLIDGKFGTKTAITVSVIVMLLAGIFGTIGGTLMIPGIILLAIFMGAASNFTVSGAAQYWRREDFSTVFGYVNPIANIIQCAGPMMFAMLIAMVNVKAPFIVTIVISVISLILVLCFKPANVKACDDKYRAAAGKPLDDALVGRK